MGCAYVEVSNFLPVLVWNKKMKFLLNPEL